MDRSPGVNPRARDRVAFLGWLVRNGADILKPATHEYVKFRGAGVLRIVARGADGQPNGFHPPDTADIHRAFLDDQEYDLSPPGPYVEDWRVTARTLLALGARDQAGEALDLSACATELRMNVDRLRRSLAAQRDSAAMKRRRTESAPRNETHF